MSSKIGKTFQEKIQNLIINQIVNAISKGLKKYVKGLIKTFLIVLIGGFLAVVGFLFIMIGLVNYLDNYFSRELSWIIMGIISLIIGFTALLLAMPRK